MEGCNIFSPSILMNRVASAHHSIQRQPVMHSAVSNGNQSCILQYPTATSHAFCSIQRQPVMHSAVSNGNQSCILQYSTVTSHAFCSIQQSPDECPVLLQSSLPSLRYPAQQCRLPAGSLAHQHQLHAVVGSGPAPAAHVSSCIHTHTSTIYCTNTHTHMHSV